MNGQANNSVTHTEIMKNGTDNKDKHSETSFTVSDDTSTLISKEDPEEQVSLK